MIDLKFTKQRFKDHLYYSKWMYIVMAAAALVVFSMVFSVTKPVVPKEFKVDISVLGFTVQDSEKNIWQEEMLSLMPEDQQEVNIYSLGFGGDDEDASMGYTVYEIITARMAAREDDIYIVSKDLFTVFVQQGAFMPLDDIAGKYEIPEGINPDDYKATIEDPDLSDGKEHVYGLPLDGVMGLVDLGVDPNNRVLAVLTYTENYENVLIAVDYIMNKTESVLVDSVTTEQ